MIKKTLLVLWILLSWLVWFSHSYGVVVPVWDYITSSVDSSYSVNILPKWRLLSNQFWLSKSIFMLNRDNFFFWWTWWIPYFSLKTRSWTPFQWFVTSYSFCDSFDSSGFLNNCVSHSISSGSSSLFGRFLSSVSRFDYYLYDFYPWGNWVFAHFDVCISSFDFWKSLCFRPYSSKSSFTSSLWLSNIQWIDDIPYDILWDSPWINYWSNNSNSSSSIINSQITWDYSYYDCTWNDIFIALWTEWYNKNICYWWLDNFDLYDSSINYNPIPWQWLSISQIWAWDWSRAWDTFSDWFVFWNWLYKDSTNNYNAMWESYPAVYRTYFQLYNTYKWSVLDPRTVLEYCQAVNTFTGASLNNSAWWYFKKSCEKVVQEKQTGVWQYRLDWTIYSWWVYTWDTPVSVNWSWVWTMSWLNEQKDWLNFIQDFFNLAKSKIDTVYTDGYALWILPNYIVVFLLAIILFRFLSH